MLKRLQHKIPPPLWGVIVGLSMWFLALNLPLYSVELRWLKPLAMLIGGVGVSIDLYSVFLFFRAKTTINPLKPSASTLVTSGMYRFSRNPMYLGMLLILCGWGLYLATLSALFLLPVFVLIINKLQIEPEEQMLHQIFPEQFPSFCRRVRRWM